MKWMGDHLFYDLSLLCHAINRAELSTHGWCVNRIVKYSSMTQPLDFLLDRTLPGISSLLRCTGKEGNELESRKGLHFATVFFPFWACGGYDCNAVMAMTMWARSVGQ